MGRRLALMAENSHESPWTHANGSESAVRVRGLGGGKVGLRVELKDKTELLLFFPEGESSLQPYQPNLWVRYKVLKIRSEDNFLTFVEVLLGCSR